MNENRDVTSFLVSRMNQRLERGRILPKPVCTFVCTLEGPLNPVPIYTVVGEILGSMNFFLIFWSFSRIDFLLKLIEALTTSNLSFSASIGESKINWKSQVWWWRKDWWEGWTDINHGYQSRDDIYSRIFNIQWYKI